MPFTSTARCWDKAAARHGLRRRRKLVPPSMNSLWPGSLRGVIGPPKVHKLTLSFWYRHSERGGRWAFPRFVRTTKAAAKIEEPEKYQSSRRQRCRSCDCHRADRRCDELRPRDRKVCECHRSHEHTRFPGGTNCLVCAFRGHAHRIVPGSA